jgi:hypothetical protein
MNYAKHTRILILLASVLRFIIAFTTELGNDEVYYRLYASVLQWNYFDHPPIVGWLIRLTSANLLLNNSITIRLGAIISVAIATWLMYKCGELLQNSYTGFIAACIFTASIYCSIIAGTFILPDSPQIVCWVLALYLLLKITSFKLITKKSIQYIIWFGIVTGIGMLCKVHTIFLWVGFGTYILLCQKEWLKHWSIYLAALITIVACLPIIIWNVHNDFASLFFHGKRVNVVSGGISVESMLTFLGGQIFYCNPIVFFMIGVAIFKNKFAISRTHKRILLLAAMPLIIVASIISLFKELLPHWTGPGFISLILLAACYYAPKASKAYSKKLLPLTVTLANSLLVLIIVVGLIGINFYPGTLGSKDQHRYGDGDFTLDMYGWKNFGKTFDSIYRSTHQTAHANKTMIICNKWFPAAHIEMYVANPLKIPVIGYGSIEDIHQYHWLNKQRNLPINDSIDLYYIVPSNYFSEINTSELLKNFSPTKIDTVLQYRSNVLARKFYIYYYNKRKFAFNKAYL